MRLLLLLLALGCKKPDEATPPPPAPKPDTGSMTITTRGWVAGANIPALFTCDGGDKSPQVNWAGAPRESKSFLLIVDDPDAPVGTFTHWVIFDMPYPMNSIPEGDDAKGIGTVAKNDFGKTKWNGPCPPPGKGEHRYFFRLYALDVETLGLEKGCSRGEVEQKMQGHVLAKAETMGRYGR
jgi:Raf kinase inhibitor-like YbhB/YbcL family protein